MNDDIICSRKFTGGQLIALSGTSGYTDFDSGLVLRTGFDEKSIDIVYPHISKIKLGFDITKVFLGSDWLIVESGKESNKIVFIDAFTILLEGHWIIENSPKYKIKGKGNFQILSLKEIENNAFETDISNLIFQRQSYVENKKDNVPVWKQNQLCVHKAITQMNTMICSPEGKIKGYWSTPDRWPHRKMWLWDSVFHAAGMRHIDLNMAKSILTSVFDCQDQQTGFIPHMMTPQNNSEITQPPILAFGVNLILEKEGINEKSISWLNPLYYKLEKYLNWIVQNRDTDGDGLVEWFIEENEECRSGESGMDNSVRFDEAIALGAVDFNCYLSKEYLTMSHFARLLRKEKEVDSWLDKKIGLDKHINNLCWNSEKKFFFDFNFKNNKISEVKSVAGFLPIYSSSITEDVFDALIEELNNPETFATDFPIPSISIDNENFDNDMWRGPTWVNMNWLIGRKLLDTYHKEKGIEIIEKTIKVIEDNFNDFGTFFEYYDCKNKIEPPLLKRKKRCDPKRSPYHQVFFDYGWTACLYIDMVNLMQEIKNNGN